jgi:tetratricopeptide (TPR) repeat protein
MVRPAEEIQWATVCDTIFILQTTKKALTLPKECFLYLHTRMRIKNQMKHKNLSIYTVVLFFFTLMLFVGCQNSDNKVVTQQNNSEVNQRIQTLAQLDKALPEHITNEYIAECEQAVELARLIEDEQLELRCLIRLHTITSRSENYTKALQTFQEAIKLAKELEDVEAQAHIHELAGRCYYHLASFDRSYDQFDKALQKYKDLNDTSNQYDVYNMLGNIYYSWDDFDAAIEYYGKAIELSKSISDEHGIAKILTNQAIVIARRAERDSAYISSDSLYRSNQLAIDMIKNALVFLSDDSSSFIKAEILNNLAGVYASNNSLEEARLNSIKAIRYSENKSVRINANAKITYAMILMDMDSIQKSKEILHDANKITFDRDLHRLRIGVLKNLSQLHEKQGNTQKALNKYREYHSLSDSIFNQKNKQKLDAVKFDNEIDQLIQEHTIEQQARQFRSIILISILIIIILFIILLYSRQRNRNKEIKLKNQILEEDLKTRNRELNTRIMALVQRNELEKEILQNLQNLQPKLKPENKKDISDIISSLTLKQDDQLWKEFELRFESVHEEFFKKLNKLYPDLTPNEKRLCAFLYLDMSSKDISAITGQSPRAIVVARTRLRKKFNMTNENQSISSFLNKL